MAWCRAASSAVEMTAGTAATLGLRAGDQAQSDAVTEHCKKTAALLIESSFDKNNINILIIAAITSSTLYGISDEIHQAFVPSRYAGAADALADAVGSVLGVFGYHFFVNRNIDKVVLDPP